MQPIGAAASPSSTIGAFTRWILAALAIWAIAGCGDSAAVHAVDEVHNGVRTSITIEDGPPGTEVVAVFAPVDEGWHVYSMDLPALGVQGVGRPTRVSVQGGLVATGPAITDAVPFDLWVDALDAPLPTYPDGPVTLRLPVEPTADGDDVEVSFGYMACATDGGCLPPVDRTVTLRLPSD